MKSVFEYIQIYTWTINCWLEGWWFCSSPGEELYCTEGDKLNLDVSGTAQGIVEGTRTSCTRHAGTNR